MWQAVIMTVTAEVTSAQLPELIKAMQAGNDVVLTQENEPVARLVLPAPAVPPRRLVYRTFPGEVLKPYFTNGEIADEMFGPDERP